MFTFFCKLEHGASRIRRMVSSMWFIYFGFHPHLVPELSAWYNNLEQDISSDLILQFSESDTQRRCHSELQRRAGSLSEHV
ncbi:hypothetical protein MPER_06183 [Moniliophthora perniciosa FA553]|nr:hypothetical protein MPER_06183 [Moniliophthora perniciosa FA553]